LDDDDDMSDFYLSRKLVGSSLPISKSGDANLFAASPTTKSKLMETSPSAANDVDKLVMLLEVTTLYLFLTCN